MARKKAYTPKAMGQAASTAWRAIKQINNYRHMLLDQRRIMGAWKFYRWCEQHKFNDELTLALLENEEEN